MPQKQQFIIPFAFTLFTQLHVDAERRAAIDIGSGGTKVTIADIDTESSLILQIISDHSFPVPYQASLDKSPDGTFDSETQKFGMKTFKEIKDITDQHAVQRIVAVATSAFRKSNSTKEFISDVKKETDIQIQVIPQREEGEIAFFSARASGEFSSEKSVVWDIETGSLQFTTENITGGLTVYMGEQMGSVAFKNYIISALQENDIQNTTSPNPITEEVLKMADNYARGFGRGAYKIIKDNIVESGGTVIGIGPFSTTAFALSPLKMASSPAVN